MATFNFTVRATDDSGAFSDRDFSLNVRNTIVERFVAVNDTDAYSSADGVNWTVRPNSGGGSVQHLGGRWVVPKGSSYQISPDGINWTTYSFPGSIAGRFGKLGYGNGQYLVVCYDTDIAGYSLYSSSDCVNWTKKSENLIDTSYVTRLTDLIYGNGKWIIFYSNASGTVGLSSTDEGETWNTITVPGKSLNVSCGYYVNGLWLCGDFGNNHAIWTSNDGITWTPRDISAALKSAYGGTDWALYFANQITYGNGQLMVSLYKSGAWYKYLSVCLVSEDGINWRYSSFGTNYPNQYDLSIQTSVAHGNGYFVIAGDNSGGVYGGLRYTRDATSWSSNSINAHTVAALSNS